jgi:hypothetical protein
MAATAYSSRRLRLAGKPMVPGTAPPDTLPVSYMAGIPASDAKAYPVRSDTVLTKFPPTLLLAGGRDFAGTADARELWREPDRSRTITLSIGGFRR